VRCQLAQRIDAAGTCCQQFSENSAHNQRMLQCMTQTSDGHCCAVQCMPLADAHSNPKGKRPIDRWFEEPQQAQYIHCCTQITVMGVQTFKSLHRASAKHSLAACCPIQYNVNHSGLWLKSSQVRCSREGELAFSPRTSFLKHTHHWVTAKHTPQGEIKPGDPPPIRNRRQPYTCATHQHVFVLHVLTALPRVPSPSTHQR
jgi:hypothetical protein